MASSNLLNKILVVILALMYSVNYSNGQATNNTIYIIDSIPVTERLREMDTDINPDFIDKVVVIKNKDSLRALGLGKIGKAYLIFTKAYRNRPEDIKRIPTTKNMILKKGRWYLKGSDVPYSGAFINYYISGLKQADGTFKEGKLTGLRREYYPKGNVEHEGFFDNGMANGIEKDYYEDGSLKLQGNYINNKEAGEWKSYFPNGQLQQLSKYKKGKPVGTAINYYSNGKVKAKVALRRNKIISNPQLAKTYKIYNKGIAAVKEGDYATAIDIFSKCIKMDSAFADAYFARGTAKLNSFQLDSAIQDFDKAIGIEPYYTEAIANRAFCRIRKSQIVNRRAQSTHKGASAVQAEKENTTKTNEEKQKICDDLQKAAFLGDKSKMIKQAMVQCYTHKLAAGNTSSIFGVK